ncbi:hypothetical protein D9756_005894 [Leucocoprinus leucothites]|uniref:Alkaline ceramidase 3 n=1 Tax=Leucocoprinus leucothites TaxID=201217 RepID=A0A8H5D376_9AGAR|nr:hypothetical protein D9756_005894 [Leucoagaricus leucothites]
MPGFSTIAPWLNKTGFYGPVTATLDWCEANHQFSPYIAEMANSISNLYTIIISVIGYWSVVKQSLPRRYALGYLGVTLVGIGSFLFHATLLYEAQLADELPMIYVGSMSLFITFDDGAGYGVHSLRSKSLIAILLLFDVLFTWSYYIYRNPVYHQVVFATIIFLTTGRLTYLLKWSNAARRIPATAKRTITKLLGTGSCQSGGLSLFFLKDTLGGTSSLGLEPTTSLLEFNTRKAPALTPSPVIDLVLALSASRMTQRDIRLVGITDFRTFNAYVHTRIRL